MVDGQDSIDWNRHGCLEFVALRAMVKEEAVSIDMAEDLQEWEVLEAKLLRFEDELRGHCAGPSRPSDSALISQ